MAGSRMLLAALLAVGLCAVQAQLPAGVNSSGPVMSNTFAPMCGTPTTVSGAPATISMPMPAYFEGPWNCTYIFSDGMMGAGLTVNFPSLSMTPGAWVRVSACSDMTCASKSFLGYATPNATLRTDKFYISVDLMFEGIVDPEWFPITVANVAPGCTVAANDTCVSKYSTGCLTAAPQIPGLAPSDPCYATATLTNCVQAACINCAAQCADVNATKDPQCEGLCLKTNTPMGFCAPSCMNMMLGDGMCNPECDNMACSYDGGDCRATPLNSTIVPAGGIASALQATADANGDGLVSYEEYVAMGASLPMLADGMHSFTMANFKRDAGLDVFELASLMQTETVDMFLDVEPLMDVTSLKMAGGLIRLADMDLDNMASPSELMMTYGLHSGPFSTLLNMGLFPKDQMMHKPMGVTVDALAHVIFGVYVSLSGRTLTMPPFDNEAATHALVMLLDWDMDGKLSAPEAAMIGFSKALFGAMDADEDMYVTEKELYDMQKDMMAGGCAGVVLLTDREVDVKTKAPLTGTVQRKCSFLMSPDWFYAEEKMAAAQNPVHPPMGGRRLLSVEGQVSAAPAASSVVMSRRTGPVPNHHLLAAATAKKHVARDVHHGRRLLSSHAAPAAATAAPTELDTGIAFNATNETMPWLVQVKSWDNMTMMWTPACIGALIHPKFVMVSPSCTMMRESMGDLQVTFYDNTMGLSAGVLVNPVADQWGWGYGALIELQMEAVGKTTIQLHDGAGLDLTECKQPVVTVGLAQMQAFPTMTRQAVDVSMSGDCATAHKDFSRIGYVGHSSICTKARRGAVPACFAMNDAVMLAPHPENPLQYVLVGVKGTELAPHCGDPLVPSVFTQVAATLNWILSLPTFGKFPALLLSVETEKLEITDGQLVHVKTGSTLNSPTAGAIETKCSPGGTYWDEEAHGSLLVEIVSPPSVGYFDSEITLDFEVSGCGETPMMKPGSTGMDCEKLKGCHHVPATMMPGMEPTPAMCTAPRCQFTKEWKDVTKELQAKGKAFTGGLGGEAWVNGAVEYRQWMCARDWDVEEQLGCMVGPGELACFRFEEMSDTFVSYGRNFDKKIVSRAKEMEGMSKEKKGLTAIG